MHLIDKNQYHKALSALLEVRINHLFARSVVENHLSGSVYTDDPVNPSAFYVVHPYGMSLLYGQSNNPGFTGKVLDYMLNKNKERQKIEWMQAWPQAWHDIINQHARHILVKPDEGIEPGTIEVHTRVNFRFNFEKYRLFRVDLHRANHSIVATDESLFKRMEGTVIPLNFWDNSADFCKYGVGFSLVINDEPACTAYSAYIFDRQLELGIETRPEYRGKGFAIYTCSALIDYCLENNYEPVWSCRLENTASYRLAQKLGFEPKVTFPFYRLPV